MGNMNDKVPREVYLYGSVDPLPETVRLYAGSVEMAYERGNLRSIKGGDVEILRMLYPAVRDQNWDTIPGVMKNEKVETGEKKFQIRYDKHYQQDDIDFIAHYELEGDEKGQITVKMTGKANSKFKKNRVGLCILHPIEECAGKEVEIIHSDNSKERAMFPFEINPHQPFKDIKKMTWRVEGGCKAVLTFEGDIFEMEDQRNWTDASYKTYSTPLDNPFPVTMNKGETIEQKVTLQIQGVPPSADYKPSRIIFEYNLQEKFLLPDIGVCRSSTIEKMRDAEIVTFKKLGFSHYRIDVKFHEENWKDKLADALSEASELDYVIKMALHFHINPVIEMSNFVLESRNHKDQIKQILVFKSGHKTTPDSLLSRITSVLRGNFPGAKIGAGTDAYFTELNRDRVSTDKIDFINYSLNPQVHAFDHTTLVENLKGQGYTVQSALNFSGGKQIHVSPVTLKPRFNPNSTTVDSRVDDEQLPADVDTRQMSLFGAGWTLGSIKYLSEAGVQNITYYETVGLKGLMMGLKESPYPEEFMVKAGKVFPVFHLFYDILSFGECIVVASHSTNHMKVDGIILAKGEIKRCILANYTNELQHLEIKLNKPAAKVKIIDQENVEMAMSIPSVIFNKFEDRETEKGILKLDINPFALTTIDF